MEYYAKDLAACYVSLVGTRCGVRGCGFDSEEVQGTGCLAAQSFLASPDGLHLDDISEARAAQLRKLDAVDAGLTQVPAIPGNPLARPLHPRLIRSCFRVVAVLFAVVSRGT